MHHTTQSRTDTSIYQTSTAPDNYNVDIKNRTSEALVAGLHFKPTPWLKVGLVFQDELFMEIAGANYVNVEGGTLPNQILDLVQNGLPLRLTGAVAISIDDVHSLALEGTWLNWSRFRSSHAESLELNDVVHTKVGLESKLKGGSYLRLGLAYQPTPTELQTGRTNVVDNDRVMVALALVETFLSWNDSFDSTLRFRGMRCGIGRFRKLERMDS